ncbi:hypothetical protein [Cellulomonas bogoriensis]
MTRRTAALTATALSLALALAGASGAAASGGGSDAPTPYRVTGTGLDLPEGAALARHGHVNVRWASIEGDGSVNVHLGGPSSPWHDLEGATSVTWERLGLPADACIEWVQVHGFDEHFGEGGQAPVCRSVPMRPAATPAPAPAVPAPAPAHEVDDEVPAVGSSPVQAAPAPADSAPDAPAPEPQPVADDVVGPVDGDVVPVLTGPGVVPVAGVAPVVAAGDVDVVDPAAVVLDPVPAPEPQQLAATGASALPFAAFVAASLLVGGFLLAHRARPRGARA